MKKIDGCENNSENSPTIKVGEHISKTIENKHENIREHTMEIINIKKKKIIDKKTAENISKCKNLL